MRVAHKSIMAVDMFISEGELCGSTRRFID